MKRTPRGPGAAILNPDSIFTLHLGEYPHSRQRNGVNAREMGSSLDMRHFNSTLEENKSCSLGPSRDADWERHDMPMHIPSQIFFAC